MLVWRRFARAARTAAHVSGSKTTAAMTMPTTALGASASSTARSIVGESFLARPTTITSASKSNPKLAHASALVGGAACVSKSEASATGMK